MSWLAIIMVCATGMVILDSKSTVKKRLKNIQKNIAEII